MTLSMWRSMPRLAVGLAGFTAMMNMYAPQAVLPEITIKKDVHMNKLPNAVKWLIVLAVLGAMGVLMWKVNDRASRVEMPAPDNTFGIYRSASST